MVLNTNSHCVSRNCAESACVCWRRPPKQAPHSHSGHSTRWMTLGATARQPHARPGHAITPPNGIFLHTTSTQSQRARAPLRTPYTVSRRAPRRAPLRHSGHCTPSQPWRPSIHWPRSNWGRIGATQGSAGARLTTHTNKQNGAKTLCNLEGDTRGNENCPAEQKHTSTRAYSAFAHCTSPLLPPDASWGCFGVTFGVLWGLPARNICVFFLATQRVQFDVCTFRTLSAARQHMHFRRLWRSVRLFCGIFGIVPKIFAILPQGCVSVCQRNGEEFCEIFAEKLVFEPQK